MGIARISDPHRRPERVFCNGLVDPAAALAVDQISRPVPARPDLLLLTGGVARSGSAPEQALARRRPGRRHHRNGSAMRTHGVPLGVFAWLLSLRRSYHMLARARSGHSRS
jgi:hypothetical protein